MDISNIDKMKEPVECERMIPHSTSWSKWKVKCKKIAVGFDAVNNRHLCQKCSDKFKKQQLKNESN
jgi:hypothetical protein